MCPGWALTNRRTWALVDRALSDRRGALTGAVVGRSGGTLALDLGEQPPGGAGRQLQAAGDLLGDGHPLQVQPSDLGDACSSGWGATPPPAWRAPPGGARRALTTGGRWRRPRSGGRGC